MKFTKRLKDMFLVRTPEGDIRLSKDMIGNTVILVSSVLVAVGGVGQAITGFETEAITAGALAVGNIILRLTSDGGTIKSKEDKTSGWFKTNTH